MITSRLKKNQVNALLIIFCTVTLFLWTLIPSLIRLNLPMDSLEGAVWGKALSWGYDKNPFMNAWVTQLAIIIGHYSDWAIYGMSQLSVIVCFYAVWLLAKKVLPREHALIAVMLLSGIQYYNLHSIDLSDNSLELALWSLITLFFYKAIKEKNYLHWILTGFFVGLGLMTKYYTALLLLSMGLFLVINTAARSEWRNPALHIAVFIGLIVIAPHIYWLTQHNFITVNYTLDRISSSSALYNHFYYPSLFALQQLEVLIPFFLFFGILFLGKKKLNSAPKIPISRFDRDFFIIMGLGPFILTLLISALTGIQLRAAWGQPLFSLLSILLLLFFQPSLTSTKFYRFIVLMYGFMLLTVIGYSIALTRAEEPSSANFPGQTIANTLTQRWHDRYKKPLAYISGSRWMTSNIYYYSPDHPYAFINWNKQISFWINAAQFNQAGSIFVWDLTGSEKVPSYDELKAQYKTLSAPEIMHFSWLRNKKMAPIEIMVAYLPPA